MCSNDSASNPDSASNMSELDKANEMCYKTARPAPVAVSVWP